MTGPLASKLKPLAAILALVVIPLLVYLPAVRYGFALDDALHVRDNSLIRHPRLLNVLHVWEEPYMGLYIPVTYTAWMLQADMTQRIQHAMEPDGANPPLTPKLFHATNIGVHVVNGLLVFAILLFLTGRRWPAATGALFFSLHPVQAEAVVWISELKGLLSGLFALSAILLYLLAARPPAAVALPRLRVQLYLAGLVAFGLAVLSKPIAMSVPLMLLVLDLLVLRRKPRTALLSCLPWLAAAMLLSLPTVAAQSDHILRYVTPLADRPAVALDALAFYLRKLFWPHPLALDYGRTPEMVLQHPWLPQLCLVPVAAALALLALRKRLGFLIAPYAMFCLGLLPVLGLKQFIFQEFSTVADRYMYLAMLGAALGLALLADRLDNKRRPAVRAGLVGLLLALALTARWQVGFWQDDATLYRHVLAINPRSFLAHNSVGTGLEEKGMLQEAETEYQQALSVHPDYLEARLNLASLLARVGQYGKAEEHYRYILSIAPRYMEGHLRLGHVLAGSGRHLEAAASYREAIRLKPNDPYARFCLANALVAAGVTEEAQVAYGQAVTLKPDFMEAQANLASLLRHLGKNDEAIPHFREALSVNQGSAPLRYSLGLSLEAVGSLDEAARQFKEALRLDPGFAQAQASLEELAARAAAPR